MSEPISYHMLVNGKLASSPKTFPVINPSTAQPFAQAPECSPEVLEQAIAGAKEAFKKWRHTSFAERKEYMQKAIAKIKIAMPQIANILTKEQGKPLKAAMGEIGALLHFLNSFSDFKVEDRVLLDDERELVIEKRVPLGVVGGITPWNFPALMAGWKLGEATMTGNTIVLKPSPYTPLSTLMLSEAFVDAFPPGVVNFVSGSDHLGKLITEHPDVAKINFTGSTRTGKLIQAATSGTLKRLTLELGGNDPAIILKDADVKAAAKGVFAAAMQNTGQVCVAVKRAFVAKSIHDDFVNELVEVARKAKVGDGFEKDVNFGPINNKMQFDLVSSLVEDAKRAGAKVHAGGSPLPGDGYFYPLTILSNVKEGVRIVDEEQFGPVLPVIAYDDEDDVIDRANDTVYGLGGSVWGPSERASQVAAKLDSGTVWVNSHAKMTPDVPFGGRKESGVGRQMGSGTLEGHTEAKIIRIPKERSKL